MSAHRRTITKKYIVPCPSLSSPIISYYIVPQWQCKYRLNDQLAHHKAQGFYMQKQTIDNAVGSFKGVSSSFLRVKFLNKDLKTKLFEHIPCSTSIFSKWTNDK